MIVNIMEEKTSVEIVLLLVRHVISVNAKIILQMYVGHPKTDLNQEVEGRKKSHGGTHSKQNYHSVQRSDSSCSDDRDVENFKFDEIKCVDSTSKSRCKIMCHLKVNDKHFT